MSKQSENQDQADERFNKNKPAADPRGETSDKEALNGVSPKDSQITGHGKDRQTTKQSSAEAASRAQDKNKAAE